MRQFCTSAAGLCALLVAAGGPAVAQEFTYSGFVELEYIDGGSFNSGFWGTTDLSASVDFGTGFGLDFGLNTFIGRDSAGENKIREAIYAAASYTLGQNKFSFGVPVPAMEDMIDLPAIGGNHAFEARNVAFTSRNIADTLYQRSDGDIPYGLRYDGEFGAAKVGASIHRFDDQDINYYNMGASYDIQNYQVFAGFEKATGGRDVDMVIVGASSDYGVVSGGLAYFSRRFDDGTNPDTDGTRAWFDYHPTDELTVGASAVNTNRIDVYGLSMSYQMPIGLYAQAGAVDGRDYDRVYDLSVGFKF